MTYNTSMELITSSRAAKILGISKRTLYRWEKERRVRSKREGILNIRVYDQDYIEMAKKILDLDKKEKEHLKNLPNIKKEIEEHHLLQEYIPGKPLKLSTEEEVKAAMKAFDAEEVWVEQHKRILNELFTFPQEIIRELLK